MLYRPPALALSRNSILFLVKVYSSCCSSGEQIRSDELALSHGKAILFKNFEASQSQHTGLRPSAPNDA